MVRKMRHRPQGRAWLAVVVALASIVLAIVVVLQASRETALPILSQSGQSEIAELWRNNEYQEVVAIADRFLTDTPLNNEFLFLRGAANYYRAQDEVSFEEQVVAYNQTMTDLRRAMVVGDDAQTDEINYLLGKTYYHKGYYYYDLSLRHLMAAEEAGFHRSDSFEYLGLVSAELGLLDQAIEFLNASHNENGRAIILITIARLYASSEDYESALEFALRAFDESQDTFEKEQSLLIAGAAYRSEARWDDAQRVYEDLFELNNNSADAKFYLGEIYAARGDTVQARVFWREAYAINPRHPGAISRLNS